MNEKQKALREGLAERIYERHIASRTAPSIFHIPTWEEIADDAKASWHRRAEDDITFLSEQGLVFRVEGVPKWFTFKWVGTQPDEILLDDITEAGLSATVPLQEAKEKDNG